MERLVGHQAVRDARRVCVGRPLDFQMGNTDDPALLAVLVFINDGRIFLDDLRELLCPKGIHRVDVMRQETLILQ